MQNDLYFGVDVGGTMISISAGILQEDTVEIVRKESFHTIANNPNANIEKIIQLLKQKQKQLGNPVSVGVACGGPLDSRAGMVHSPPNLPGWDEVPISSKISKALGVEVYLENDANASALAEFHFGAGRQINSMVFLTFGTGMGAGLILDGQLYRGGNGNAGEVGHIRLAKEGPVGHSKAGSFEGFCSGGGIAQLGHMCIQQHIEQQTASEWALQNKENASLSAKDIFDAARAGDLVAVDVVKICGEYLGRGLAVLVDVLNPERIVIGSVFVRAGDLLVEHMQKTLQQEALPESLAACEVVPAELGESLGDYAALGIAVDRALQQKKLHA